MHSHEAPGALGTTVEDLTYGDDVAAWLVRPAGDDATRGHAGILMWHWLSTEEPILGRVLRLG